MLHLRKARTKSWDNATRTRRKSSFKFALCCPICLQGSPFEAIRRTIATSIESHCPLSYEHRVAAAIQGFFWSDIGIAPLDKGIYKTIPIRRVPTITFIGYKGSLLQQLNEWKANLDAQIQANLFESDSDEELLMDILLPQLEELANEVDERKQWGGSTFGRLHGLKKDRIGSHERIIANYFTKTPVYDERFFQHRFRMRRPLFLRIMAAIVAFNDYFLQKPNAVRLMGLSSIEKCTVTLRMLAYGIAADAIDEYVRLGANMAMLSMKCFCAAIHGCFQSTYLRSPTRED